MKIFRNKILIKIIASLCIVLTIMNLGIPNRAYADWGGMLIKPATNLLVTISDGVISILHKTIQYQDVALIEISGDPNWWSKLGETAIKWAAIAIVALVATAAVIATMGAAAAAGASVAIAALKTGLVIGAIEIVSVTVTGQGALSFTGQFVAERLGDWWFPDTLYMPAFTLTPEHIFSNKIPLFDINFFNPMEEQTKEIESVVNQEARYKYESMHNNGKFQYDTADGNILGYVMQLEDVDGVASKFFIAINSKLSSEDKINTHDTINTYIGQRCYNTMGNKFRWSYTVTDILKFLMLLRTTMI